MKTSPITILTCLVLASAVTAVRAQNLVVNGDFSSGKTTPWKIFSTQGEQEPGEPQLVDNAVTISLPEASVKSWARMMAQDVILESNTAYVLNFEAATESTAGLEITALLDPKDHGEHYGLRRRLTLSADWQPYSIKFTTKTIDPANPPVLKFHFGLLNENVSFRNIELKPASGS